MKRWTTSISTLALIACLTPEAEAQWTAQALDKLTANDAGNFDAFGTSLAVSGTTAIVGAPTANPHGASYIHERDAGGPGAWGQVAKLTKRNGSVSDLMGDAVAICGDTAAVGVRRDNHSGFSNPGSAVVFERDQAGPVEGLAFDPGTGTLYGVEVSSDELVAIDLVTANATRLGAVGFGRVRALAFDPNSNTLFGADAESGLLIRINTSTGAGTAVGPHGLGVVSGLAYDAGTDTLYGSDTQSKQLVTLDTTTGVGTAVGPIGFNRVRGLACDPVSGALFGTDNATDQLISIDPVTGAGMAVGALGYDLVEGLSFDASGASLYGCDLSPARLVSIDTSLGNATDGGRLQLPDGWGEVANLLPSDPHDNGDFGVSIAISGDTLAVGASDFGFGPGSAYVFERNLGGAGAWGERAILTASDGQLADFFGRSVAIDGDTIVVGANGVQWANSGSAYVFERDLGGADAWGEAALLSGLGSGFDNYGCAAAIRGDVAMVGAKAESGPGAAYVYGRDVGGPGAWGELAHLVSSDGVELDNFGSGVALSGSSFVVGAPGAGGNAGAAYAFDADFAEVAKWTADDVVVGDGFAFSVAVAGGTVLAGSPDHEFEGSSVAGAVYAYALSGAETYCTPGTSAEGCQPTVVAGGVASSTEADGFELHALGVPGDREGLFFFGTNGRQALPWGNGTSLQCVIPPVRRAGVLAAAGTRSQCDGGFVQDLNALWCPGCPKPQLNPGPGSVVQAQLWYRDPQNTSNRTTSLSAAIEFQLAP